MTREQTLWNELLACLESGSPCSPALRAFARPGALTAAREAADVLKAAQRLPSLVGPLGVELLRSQFEFNHALLDVVEDRCWSGTVRIERARRLTTFSQQIPRRAGVRGTVIFASKRLAVAAARRAFRRELQSLERSNHHLLRWAVDRDDSEFRAARNELDALGRFAPIQQSQKRFIEALERLASRNPNATTSAPSCDVQPASRLTVLFEDHHDTCSLEGHEGLPLSELELATGDAVVRVGAGAQLKPGALTAIARAFDDPAIALVYGDRTTGEHRSFLPAWSPELLWAENYIGQTFAVRASRVREAGLRSGQSALDWLLQPNFGDDEVINLHQVVADAPKPTETEVELDAIRQELVRRDLHGTVTTHLEGRRVVLTPSTDSVVSIVVPFRDKVELLESLWRTLTSIDAGVKWELIAVDNDSKEPDTHRFLEKLVGAGVRVLPWPRAFNYAELNNAAARIARGDFLLFLNNDTEVREPGWLAQLVGYAQRPEIGVVSPRLVYADGTTQHAGVVIGLRGLAGHAFARWETASGSTPFGRPDITRNWSAVTGACMLMRRNLFEQVGGFDEGLAVSGNDIELCLRVREMGLRVVNVGHVVVAHLESQSRGRAPLSRANLVREARAYTRLILEGDPYWHPELTWEFGGGVPRVSADDTPLRQAASSLLPLLA